MAAHLTAGVPQRISEAFEVAARGAGGVVERCYRFAGHPVTIRAAGTVVSDWLDGTFHHLRTECVEAPELTVLAWDGLGGGSFPLDPTANMTAAWRQGPLFVEFEPAGENEGQWRRMSGLIDPSLAVYWMVDPERLAWFERGTPLLTALQRWLAARGVWLVHAGAVATSGGAILIGGDNGAGKSTTSLACYEAGLSFLSDDYVAIELDPPRAHSVFCSAKLAWDHPAAVGRTLHPVNDRERGDEKALFLLADRVLATAPIMAIVTPRVKVGEPAALRPISPARALLSLAPSSVLQLAGGGEERLGALRSLCQQVPAYELVLGDDVKVAAALVRDLLGGEASP